MASIEDEPSGTSTVLLKQLVELAIINVVSFIIYYVNCYYNCKF